MNNLEYSYLNNDDVIIKPQIKIDSEFKFFIQLYEHLDKDKYFLTKSSNKYCSIDFMIMENSTLKTLYLEHKSRLRYEAFDTFLISKKKLDNIDKNYSNTFLIYEFKDGLYYCKFNKDLLNSKENFVCGGACYELEKKHFKTGFNNLIIDIKQELKPFNTY